MKTLILSLLAIIIIASILASCGYAIYIIIKGFLNAKANNRKAQLHKSRKLNGQLKTVN